MAPYGRSPTTALAVSLAVHSAAASDAVVLRQQLSHVFSGTPAAAISEGGRFVAFVSMATLVATDTNSLPDIYVFDRQTRTLTLETVAADGGAANGSSFVPRLSGNGRFLAFESVATNLTSDPDGKDYQRVFVRDRETATTSVISRPAGGGTANATSTAPAISADGQFVAFLSSATNLVPGPDANGIAPDVYLANVESGEIVRVSVDEAGHQFGGTGAPGVSADGRLVVFSASIVAPYSRPRSDAATSRHVYLRDVAAPGAVCISCNGPRPDRGRAAFAPDISPDGAVVVFAVQTTPVRTDVAVHERVSARTTVITRDANARSAAPRVSSGGRFVVFESWASNLLCSGRCSETAADENALADVYVFDREARRIDRVSGSGGQWWVPSLSPTIDASGRTIAFVSRQPFGPEDHTVDFDLFVCSPLCR